MSTSNRETVLTIPNFHFTGCGKPPQLEVGKGCYMAYFENCHGEQCVMQMGEDKICHLWMGDVGWEEPLRVEIFREGVVVLFERTAEQRKAKFQMNTQFAPDEDEGEDDAARVKDAADFRQHIHKVLRQVHVKPRLTDQECDYLMNHPMLSKDELNAVSAIYCGWRRRDIIREARNKTNHK
jgi:hypothetical protein